MQELTRRGFVGGMAAMAAVGQAADLAVAGDWVPSERWRGVNLLGMFRCPSLGLRPDPRAEGHFMEWEFEALREWGFNFARLPLDYRILVSGDSWTNLSENKLKFLDEAIDWGRQYGIHVQIALHRIPGYCILDQTEAFPLGTSPVAQEAACAMWSAFAKRWKGIPNESLSFNLFNEPTRHTAGENYLPLCMKLIDAIRKEDPSRFIIADGNACASLPVPGLYGIPSVGQAFRGYTPHAITHYGVDFIGGIPKDPPTWPLAPGYGAHAWLRESPEDTVAKYQSAIDAGEFCMVGEFGARCTSPHGVVLDWMEHCLGLWQSKNLGWAIWNLRGVFGFMDSGRADVAYEGFRGHKLDRKMLELLRRY
jgi:endoglucanase